MIRTVLILCTLLTAPAAGAQTFQVILAGKTLGQMRFVAEGRDATLRSTLNSTPLGVFNGTFVGTSTAEGRFTGDSKSSRKQRVVIVDITEGRAQNVEITPLEEITELSDIARVPDNLMDPVRIIGALIHAGGCPRAMRMYDGRRVVTLRPDGEGREGDALICSMDYAVMDGPGHLSPLGISSAKMALAYASPEGRQTLREIKISSGLFRLRLVRSD